MNVLMKGKMMITMMVIMMMIIVSMTMKMVVVVNAKKQVNDQSVPRVLLSKYVSYSQVGKEIGSQVGPKRFPQQAICKREGSQRNRGTIPRLSSDA